MGGIVSWVPGGSGAKKIPMHMHPLWVAGCQLAEGVCQPNPLLMWSSFSQAALQRHT